MAHFNSNENLDNELFEDASESYEMDLSAAMTQAKMAVDFFFNNRFEDAKQLLQPWADQSMYHSLGYGTFMFLQAIMTFDPRDIDLASSALKQSIEVCNRQRRRATFGESLGKMVKKQDYNSFSEVEIHAELCYAECLLLRAILSFIEDETLISFLKGSLKIRACYQSYKECWDMLEGRDFSKDKFSIHFESGVRMGVGTFNLMITQLPSKILKLLEFVGFNCSRGFGLSQLELGFNLDGSIRKMLCALVLLSYHTLASYALGTSGGDLKVVKRILDDQLERYPNGALFIFFNARFHSIQGEFSTASNLYEKSRLSQGDWRQFHHVCYWELFWVNCLQGKYREAERCADLLLRESKWSKAIYAYQKACCLCIRGDLTDTEKDELRATMSSIPNLKQKIAGKSLPVEKFAVKKSAKFFAQDEYLLLGIIELLYIWNFFMILAKSHHDLERIYLQVEKENVRLERIKKEGSTRFFWEDYLMIQLIRGVSLSYMNSPLQAAEAFKVILENEKHIKEDSYLVPYAFLELGLLHVKEGDLEQAKVILEHAKNNYKGFSLESRLHFRVHSTLNRIRHIEKEASISSRTHDWDGRLLSLPSTPDDVISDLCRDVSTSCNQNEYECITGSLSKGDLDFIDDDIDDGSDTHEKENLYTSNNCCLSGNEFKKGNCIKNANGEVGHSSYMESNM